MLDQLLKRASTDRDVLWLQARLLRAAGEEDRAKQVAAIAGTATPVYGDPWTQWAMGFKSNKRVETRRFIQRVEQGQLAEAAQVLANFNAHYPDDRDGLLLGTILLARQGNKQAAITGYEALIKAHPDWASPLQQLGILLLTRERGGPPPSKDAIAQAIDYLSRAIAIDEELTTARGWLARAQSISRFWAPAIDNYHTCIKAQPLDRAHRTNLASALVQYGQPEQALVILDTADALLGEPTPSALAARARAEFKRGRLDNAEAALLRLSRLAPRHPAIRQLRAAMERAGP
jgi:tetratricopeptide (TPR) repeat protein